MHLVIAATSLPVLQPRERGCVATNVYEIAELGDAVWVYSISTMNGYYTVRLLSGGLSASDRISLETGYAQALVAAAGGEEAVRALCLQVAAGAASAVSAKELLEQARQRAEVALRSRCSVPDDCRFVIEAWTATDL